MRILDGREECGSAGGGHRSVEDILITGYNPNIGETTGRVVEQCGEVEGMGAGGKGRAYGRAR